MHSSYSFCLGALLQLVLATVSLGAAAQTLTFADALELAASHSPELLPWQRRVEDVRSAGELAAQGLWPSPQGSLAAGARRGDGLGPEVTVGLTQQLPTPGLSQTQRRHAKTQQGLALGEFRVAQAESVRSAALSWFRLRAAQERVTHAAHHAERAAVLLAVTRGRAGVGLGTAADEALAASRRGQAVSALLDAEQAVRAAQNELILLIDWSGPAPPVATGPPPAGETFVLQLHPEVMAVDARSAANSAAAELIESSGRRAISVGMTLTREGTRDWVVLGTVSAPLLARNTNRYAAAQQRAGTGALQVEAQHLRERQLRASEQLQAQLRFQAELLETQLHEELEPARRALSIVQLQHDAGKVPIAALLLATDGVASAELHRVELETHYFEIMTELAYTMGTITDWARRLP